MSTIPQRLERLRHEPYRLFFPQGALLAFFGVSHWLLHSVGVLEDYRSIFHAMTQIQGFLMSFAIGFLFTMIPRRTQSAPPARWQIAVGVVAPVGTVVSAWFGAWPLSQIFWWCIAITMIEFTVRRFNGDMSRRRPPNSFVWIPVAFGMGLMGSLLTALGGILGAQFWSLHTVGRGLVLQGMFTGLVAGVASFGIPLMTRGERPADATDQPRDQWARAAHIAAAIAVFGSFVFQDAISLRYALMIRALVITAVLLLSAKIWKLPTKPGWNRKLIWLSAWAVPIGFLFAAIDHEHYKAGLHIAFIGGFALLAFTVGVHVTLGHGDGMKLLDGRPWQIAVFAMLIAAAIVPRALMEYRPHEFFRWMGIASALFIAGLGVWCAFLLPRLLREPPDLVQIGP